MVDRDPNLNPAPHGGPCCTGGALSASAENRANAARPADTFVTSARAPISHRGQVRVLGGTFVMGDHFREGYEADGERPLHEVELSMFFIDPTPVTNAQFATFAKATGYVTEAEQLDLSAVFHLAYTGDLRHVLHRVAATPWWLAVRGANWRHPEGPGSDVARRQNHPVVHVTWNDAQAYCAWAGKVLPTEAQWEYAARGGLEGARFPWGDELTPRRQWRCNVWQGIFPTENSGEDGYLTTAPVRAFRPNGYGLHQTSGNVWEWCRDWFSPDFYDQSPRHDPTGPVRGNARVMRGGSYLCHPSYCHRYRVAARSSSTPDSASANVSFRCANPGPDARAV